MSLLEVEQRVERVDATGAFGSKGKNGSKNQLGPQAFPLSHGKRVRSTDWLRRGGGVGGKSACWPSSSVRDKARFQHRGVACTGSA